MQLATSTVALPSGCKAEIRPIRIAEENLLAAAQSRRNANAARVLEQVLDACVVGIAEPGPYPFLQPGDRADWRRMLSGDKFVAMLELRKVSYRDGHLLPALGIECPNSACPPFDVSIDLDADVIRRDLTAENAAKLVAGEPFVCTIDDKKVTFVLGTGATEEMARKLVAQHPERRMAAGLRSRILDVDGVERRDILDWIDGANGASKRFPGLSSQDGEDLRDALDLVECGIDTSVDVACPQCGRSFTVELPFDSGFLMPSRGILERQRQRRLAAASLGSSASKS